MLEVPGGSDTPEPKRVQALRLNKNLGAAANDEKAGGGATVDKDAARLAAETPKTHPPAPALAVDTPGAEAAGGSAAVKKARC